jgi:hypothetical protein
VIRLDKKGVTMTKLSLDVTHPVLINQWHPLNSFPISSVSQGSSKVVWWKCNKGHEWEARISSRASGTECPYCSGRRAIPHLNDVATLHPELISSWHPDNTILMHEQSPGSQVDALWICEFGHVWETKIRNRVRGSGCLVCAGKQVLAGYNDVATTHPPVTALWDWDKNEVKPTEISHGSMREIHFRCANKHEWTYALSKQVRVSSGCSFCAGRKVVVGENDLTVTHPSIAAQWHPVRNQDLLATMVTSSMDRTVWWLGNCGHEWDMAIYMRTHETKGQNCPICSGARVLKGFNDLTTLVPHLVSEWDYSLNTKTPDMYTRGANKKVFWKCVKGHSWQAKIADRVIKSSGCPACSAALTVSQAEHDIANFLTAHGLVLRQSDRKALNGLELDIYIEDHKLGIEYNGLYWHSESFGKDSKYHYNKWYVAKQKGIQLIQIWEDEWKRNPEQIKAMLLHKLKLSGPDKIYARNTDIVMLNKARIEEFLEQNHVQGFAAGSYYLGLVEKDAAEIVSVIVLKKDVNNSLNIVRYATSKNVVGGFTKLLKYAERNFAPSSFITFSDNCVSDGGLYENNGFIADKELPPDYRYVINGRREHKFGYRLKRFRNDPTLKWEDGLTERELAVLNNIPRIWDAGKTRWVKKVIGN